MLEDTGDTIACPFRSDVHYWQSGEQATCLLVARITNANPKFCKVDRSACLACVLSPLTSVLGKHPVVASLVYRACSDQLNVLSDADDRSQLEFHREWAEASIRSTQVLNQPSQRRSPRLVHHHDDFDLDVVLDRQVENCDVVLPFFDHPEFVHEAVQSVLAQSDINVVLHLINDAGPHGDSIFSRWKSHPNVRCYQNATNIGPYISFNNVSRFFETEYVAVQDADDISLPDRLEHSVRLLRLCGASVLGGTSETFGDESIIRPEDEIVEERVKVPRARFRESRYPSPGMHYVLENPTAVMRVLTFRELGGYADFGSRDVNRSSLDTEFYARAFYSGMPFSITKKVVLKYRYHSGSLMQCQETGWGSASHAQAAAERCRRIKLYQSSPTFDPRSFGALGMHNNLTRPT